MNAEALAQAMFMAEPAARCIAIADGEYNVLISTQREGVKSLVSEETSRNIVSIFAQIIVDAVQKLFPFLGRVGDITAHYEKVASIFTALGS